MDMQQLRLAIPSLRDKVYLNTSGHGPSPVQVMAAVYEWMEYQNRVGPAGAQVKQRMFDLLDETRAAAAAFLHCGADEIALAHNATDGLLVAAWGRNWQAGDEVILTNHEHPGNLLPWYNLAARYGVAVRFASLDRDADPMASLAEKLTERTRLISISHVSRRSGRIVPIDAIAALARPRGIRLLVDGAQAVGAIPVDLRALGCDYYAWSGHKWLLGPEGTGGLYVRREILEETLPSWIGAHSEAHLDMEGGYRWLPRAARFEFGTQAFSLYAGLLETFRWLGELGWPAIYGRAAALAGLLAQRLQAIPGVRLLRDPGEPSPIVGFRTPAGITGEDLARRLWEAGRFLVAPLGYTSDEVRISTHFFNTEEEVEAVARAIDLLGRKAP